MLRLSRFRRDDPLLQHRTSDWQHLASKDNPKLEAPSPTDEEGDVLLELPEYDLRRAATMRDPHSVVEGFLVNIKLRLAWLLGVRMCPDCPRCNEPDAHGRRYGCQDKFGSNMRPMGGVVGAATALGGGAEHQQVGTPHFHLQVHVVCMYQYGTLQDIAEKFETGLVECKAVLDYQSWLHREDVLDVEEHAAYDDQHAATEFGKRFAGPEHHRLAQTPRYLVEDVFTQHSESTLWSEQPATPEASVEEGRVFKAKYFQDVQFVFNRVQRHMHNFSKKSGHRPMRACRKKNCKGNICKHDFPKTLSEDVQICCAGVAKKLKLRISGRRNAFGSVIGKRSCVWQSGTTPAFAAAFGSNTHTMPGYRLPIVAATHDSSACKSAKCKRQLQDDGKRTTKLICKLAQRVQRECTGYFCGYTLKVQPVGDSHIKKIAVCFDYMRHSNLKDKSVPQIHHRISHKVFLELAHRCMLRTAPEEWNLASNYHPNDVTNAEFLRTYRNVVFPSWHLRQRLLLECSADSTAKCKKVVPSVLPTTSEKYVKMFADLYGYRGDDCRVYRLSPWEFLMHWEVKSVPAPAASHKLSKWLPGWSLEAMCGEVPQPRVHFEVNPRAASDTVLLYPREYRDVWYMRKTTPPMVPSIAASDLPDRQPNQEEKKKLLSLYLRPWVLDDSYASIEVPHLSDLDVTRAEHHFREAPKRRRIKGPAFPRRSYASSWTEYVRGNVVSQHAARIITQFQAACCGRSKTRDDVEPTAETSGSNFVPQGNDVPLARVHAVLDGLAQNKPNRHDEGAAEDDDCQKPSSVVQDSLQLASKLWEGSRTTPWPDEIQGKSMERSSFATGFGTAENPTRNGPKNAAQPTKKAKIRESKMGQAHLKLTPVAVEAWWTKVRGQKELPTEEHEAFLQTVITRCFQEAAEEQSGTATATETSEPFLGCLLGIPGAGKSTCLRLVRDFFETCLGWEMGVQFVYLATQNTMAALIGGFTVHSWATIPVNSSDAIEKINSKACAGEVDELFAKVQCLRWIFVDECSTLSPYLFGILDVYLRRACSSQRYAKRFRQQRRFGGINIGICGDLWQLPPVKSSAIFGNPYKKGYDFLEQSTYKMFWHKGKDSVQQTFFLTKSLRTDDPWLEAVLKACRYGSESWEMYCFVHGLPTRNTGTWLPDVALPLCGQHSCLQLARETWPQDWSAGVSWSTRQSKECEECKIERKRRCRIIARDEANPAYLQSPFVEAPYVHPFRAPSYYTQLLRAVGLAKKMQEKIYWIAAHDKVACKGGGASVGSVTEARKQYYLQLHDGKTGGIPGIFPCLINLPVKFTDSLRRDLGIFKHAKGILRGWEFTEEEAARVALIEAPEIVLKNWPRKLFIEVPKAFDTLPLTNGKKIFVLQPQMKPWALGSGGLKLQRYGFPLVPDFGGTAHAYCGETLDAALGDLLAWHKKPCLDDTLRGYIILSRVRRADHMLLAQPYSPALFSQGTPPGPRQLKDVLGDAVTPREAERKWKEFEKQKKEKDQADDRNAKWLDEIPLPCRRCTDLGVPTRLTGKYFPGHDPASKWHRTVSKGQDALCTRCVGVMRKLDMKLQMYCEGCCAYKESKEFFLTDQKEWGAAIKEDRQDFVRFFCTTCSSGQSGAKMQDALKDFFCNGACKKMLPETSFLNEDLEDCANRSSALRLRCVRCKLRQGDLVDDGEDVECVDCMRSKPKHEFGVGSIKSWLARGVANSKWRCYDCQHPPCAYVDGDGELCGDAGRPIFASRNYKALRNGKYYCTAHRYPKCDTVGCGKPRPRHLQMHIADTPCWICKDCTTGKEPREDHPCEICKQRAVLTNHAFSSWRCTACMHPSCTSCKVMPVYTPDTAQFHAGLYYCAACAYPPCAGCNAQRPRQSKYAIQKMPHWKCETCIARPPCVRCGSKPNTRPKNVEYVHGKYYCPACTHPGCEDCGAPRPKKKEYSIHEMPHWKCKTCSSKFSCETCGAKPLETVRLHHVVGERWYCKKCRYPPCEGCGAKRPQESKYSISAMEHWTCKRCKRA